MMEAIATVLAATVAAVASVIVAAITVGQRKKVEETHKQVTVNHHSSQEPTVLDRIDDVKILVLELGGRMNDLTRDVNELTREVYEHEKQGSAMELRLTKVEGEVIERP